MVIEKDQKILEAAFKVFAAYGFKRVTMADIAKEAGMSRPALYLVFPNKEAIFRAMVEKFNNQALNENKEGVSKLNELKEQLEFLFENWLVQTYEMIHASPHGSELIDEGYGIAGDLMDRLYRSYEGLLLEIISPRLDQLEKEEIDAQTFVHLIRLSANSCKLQANSVEELRGLLSVLIQTILKVIKD